MSADTVTGSDTTGAPDGPPPGRPGPGSPTVREESLPGGSAGFRAAIAPVYERYKQKAGGAFLDAFLRETEA